MGLITYDGENPFEGVDDPLVSMSTSYDDNDGQWSRTDTYSFNGTVTGCSFSALMEKQSDIQLATDTKAGEI